MSKSKLYIETTNGRSEAEVIGTEAEILFNWTALTNIVCQKLHLAPTQLALMLPGMLDTFTRSALKQAMEIDVAAIRRAGREGQP